MRQFLFFFTNIIIILSLIACSDCPGDNEECPHGHWDSNNCYCTCDDSYCDHGYFDSDNCHCDCYDDYTGVYCDVYTPSNDFTADISIDEGAIFHYFPEHFDLHVNTGNLADSLWIDAYNENGTGDADDYYVFIYAIVPEITNITDTLVVPITGNYFVNNCWASMQDPNFPGFYANGNNGTLSINSVHENAAESGTYLVEATFDYTLFNGSNFAHIVGYFEGKIAP